MPVVVAGFSMPWVRAIGMVQDKVPVIVETWADTDEKARLTARLHAWMLTVRAERWLSEQD
jgi:hypothetical protein